MDEQIQQLGERYVRLYEDGYTFKDNAIEQG